MAQGSPSGTWGDEFSATLVGTGQRQNTGRVPITPFKDWIHGLKIAHHLYWVGLLCGRINQWAVVVLQLQDSWEQPIIVLCPMGKDEVAPDIVGMLFGIIAAEL